MRGSRDRAAVPAEPTRGTPLPGTGAVVASGRAGAVWEAPAYRVLALDCEITAYAPDDEPLF